MEAIYLFDHDVFLSDAAPLNQTQRQTLKQFLRQNGYSFVISDRDYFTLVSDISKDLAHSFGACVCNSGSTVYVAGKPALKTNWEVNDLHATWFHNRLQNIQYKLRHGHLLVKKEGCGILCVPGHDADEQEQNRFAVIDRRLKIRQQICDDFNGRFSNAVARPYNQCLILITPREIFIEERIKTIKGLDLPIHYITPNRAGSLLTNEVIKTIGTDVSMAIHRMSDQQAVIRYVKGVIQMEKVFS